MRYRKDLDQVQEDKAFFLVPCSAQSHTQNRIPESLQLFPLMVVNGCSGGLDHGSNEQFI